MIDERTYRKKVKQYAIGFIVSLVLTFSAYFIVTNTYLEGMAAMIAVGVLAFSQMVVQLIFFLHLGEESRPRVKLFAFISMSIVLLIIVVGSLWIMSHLNYNMMHMSPTEKTHYMMEQKGGGF